MTSNLASMAIARANVMQLNARQIAPIEPATPGSRLAQIFAAGSSRPRDSRRLTEPFTRSTFHTVARSPQATNRALQLNRRR